MPDNNQGLEKLRKLKREIEKDLEKKTGKKRQSDETKKKLSLSDDLRKRLTESKSSNVATEEIKTVIDMERYLSDLSLTDLKGLLRNNIEKDRNIGTKENLKGTSVKHQPVPIISVRGWRWGTVITMAGRGSIPTSLPTVILSRASGLPKPGRFFIPTAQGGQSPGKR